MSCYIGKKVAIVSSNNVVEIGFIAAEQTQDHVRYLTKSYKRKFLVTNSLETPYKWWETRQESEIRVIEDVAEIEEKINAE